MNIIKQDIENPRLSRRIDLNPIHFLSSLSERHHWAYLLIAPSLILVLIIVIYPIFSGILLSFQEMRLNRPKLSGFIGLEHYAELLKDPVFVKASLNTLWWVVGGILSQFSLGMITALALNRKLRGMQLARTLVLIPWFLPSVVAGNMWVLLLDSRLGVLNDIMVKLGIIQSYKAWFADPNTAFPAALLVALWQGFPFFALLLLAGLQGIPEDLYEAAAVDGATRWRQFLHITLPLLRPIIVAVVVLRVIGMVNSPDLIVILTNGGPGHATELLSSYAFQTAYQSFDFGYAGALSVVMLLILMTFSIIYIRVSGISKE
ncbi:MAG: ABC transporter permease subunit [Anaerolineaceae bacterium]|nr:ABC transporter permease subunit [Anaerolineaceae bacterium]